MGLACCHPAYVEVTQTVYFCEVEYNEGQNTTKFIG